MSRLKSNFLYGALSDNALGNNAGNVTMNSALLASAPVVSAPDVLPIILNPQKPQTTAPEIVWITSHSASATTATVTRAQEGSTLQAHAAGEFWVQAPTVKDFSLGTLYDGVVIVDSSATSGSTPITIFTSTALSFTDTTRIRLSVFAEWLTGTVVNDQFRVEIWDGGTRIATGVTAMLNGAFGISSNLISVFTTQSPSVGSHTYTVQLNRLSGTGSATWKASSTAPSHFLIENIGV